jgi:hypothetical protein
MTFLVKAACAHDAIRGCRGTGGTRSEVALIDDSGSKVSCSVAVAVLRPSDELLVK